MKSSAHILFDMLLVPGRFIRARDTHGKARHCLYYGNMNPIRNVSTTAFRKIRNLLKEKDGKHTLDLRMVRQQHGNSYYKRKYKSLKKQ